jgi:hypothetical protein
MCHSRVQKLDRTIVTVKTDIGGRASRREAHAVEPA